MGYIRRFLTAGNTGLYADAAIVQSSPHGSAGDIIRCQRNDHWIEAHGIPDYWYPGIATHGRGSGRLAYEIGQDIDWCRGSIRIRCCQQQQQAPDIGEEGGSLYISTPGEAHV